MHKALQRRRHSAVARKEIEQQQRDRRHGNRHTGRVDRLVNNGPRQQRRKPHIVEHIVDRRAEHDGEAKLHRLLRRYPAREPPRKRRADHHARDTCHEKPCELVDVEAQMAVNEHRRGQDVDEEPGEADRRRAGQQQKPSIHSDMTVGSE